DRQRAELFTFVVRFEDQIGIELFLRIQLRERGRREEKLSRWAGDLEFADRQLDAAFVAEVKAAEPQVTDRYVAEVDRLRAELELRVHIDQSTFVAIACSDRKTTGQESDAKGAGLQHQKGVIPGPHS